VGPRRRDTDRTGASELVPTSGAYDLPPWSSAGSRLTSRSSRPTATGTLAEVLPSAAAALDVDGIVDTLGIVRQRGDVTAAGVRMAVARG
jgi:hypothetical protein